MKYVVNTEQMKRCDEATATHFHVGSAVLMERAALAVADVIRKHSTPLQQLFSAGLWGSGEAPRRGVLVLCGGGNNGGDGLAIARLLHQEGIETAFSLLVHPKERTLAHEQLLAARAYKVPEIPAEEVLRSASRFDMIVDAVFGTGLSRPVEGEIAEILSTLSADRYATRIAVDMPSGISADTGEVLGTAFKAHITVTFGFTKIGQLLYPGADYCGEILCAPIGILPEAFLGDLPEIRSITEEDLHLLPERREDSHKGTFGKVLLVAGSPDMNGAAYFSGLAAYRTGAGLVQICTPAANRESLQKLLPEAVLSTYGEEGPDDAQLRPMICQASTIVMGPGLSLSEQARKLVGDVIRIWLEEKAGPLLLDGDALTILSQDPELTELLSSRKHPDLILTPHMKEMSRLTGHPVSELKNNRFAYAGSLAKRLDAILVMKDSRTLTQLPDGSGFLNDSGCSALATAGSGDVLTGVIAGLISTGSAPSLAAPMGVWIHGKCGEAAAADEGEAAVLASELPEYIHNVMIPGAQAKM
ncbi:MAG: NAD(P)H-hydrate dehydratase [Lachnospiraceae bacterium]|nr:NAD(P)H-hydrate dehydratase [Lachnospiraceae bacterium]